MPASFVYAFEDLSSDLPRPPMAAMRALLSVGMVLSPKGWTQLPVEARQALAEAGAAEQLDLPLVEQLVRRASVGELRLVPRLSAPDNDALRPELVAALAPARRLSESEWRSLRALDRHVLRSLMLNTRLLWRAVQEILPEAVQSSSDGWRSTVAHCEVRARPDALVHLRNHTFLDGRGLVLARVAGVRAARRAAETFDLRSEVGTGTIELDWAMQDDPNVLLWQAHVSTWDGAFYPAASLVAATTAAAALCDMLRETDPNACVTTAKIAEETWSVGSAAYQEHATAVFQGRRLQPPPAAIASPQAAPPWARPAQAAEREPRQAPRVAAPARPAALAASSTSSTQQAQRALMFAILGLLVLLLLVAVAILVVIARS